MPGRTAARKTPPNLGRYSAGEEERALDKAPDAFRTISEVAEEINIPQHVLRFWESRFAQIRPLKRGGGRRYYRPDDVDLLRGVRHLLYGEGYTIRGVQRILREQGLAFVQNVWRAGAEPPPPELEEDRAGEDEAERHAATRRGRSGGRSRDRGVGARADRLANTRRDRAGIAAARREHRGPAQITDRARRPVACRQLIDDALADASLPHKD